MLLPVSRQTPTWSLPTRFRMASSSSAASPCGSRRPADAVRGRRRGRPGSGSATTTRRTAGTRRGVVERLVPPSREHHGPHDRRAGPLRPCGSRPRTARGRPGRGAERDDPFQVHRGGLGLARGGRRRGVVADPEADLDRRGHRAIGSGRGIGPASENRLAGLAGAVAGVRTGKEWMTSPSEPRLPTMRPGRVADAAAGPARLRRKRRASNVGCSRMISHRFQEDALRSASQGARYGRSSKASASGSPTTVSRSASQRSFRPSRSDRFARWQAVATRCPLSRSEIGSRRDRTQSRKLRAWRRNWSNSSPERSSTTLGPR